MCILTFTCKKKKDFMALEKGMYFFIYLVIVIISIIFRFDNYNQRGYRVGSWCEDGSFGLGMFAPDKLKLRVSLIHAT